MIHPPDVVYAQTTKEFNGLFWVLEVSITYGLYSTLNISAS